MEEAKAFKSSICISRSRVNIVHIEYSYVARTNTSATERLTVHCSDEITGKVKLSMYSHFGFEYTLVFLNVQF